MNSEETNGTPLEPASPRTKHLYTNNNFPCLVKNGAGIEDPYSTRNESEKYRRIARNGLRHLTYGTPLRESKLISWLTVKALAWKRDDKLLSALLEEMQNIFYQAFEYLEGRHLDEEAENRLDQFLKTLLAAYPYMEPEQDHKIFLPQKINNKWCLSEFKFDKIDISPQKGPIAKLITDKYRIYAYGLVPSDKRNQPYLIAKGSDILTGQGALINWLYNFAPNQSVGEGHDLTHITRWLIQHAGAKVTGHSKGGTMAMIIAAKFFDLVSEANCLNPAPLNTETIKRLNLILKKIPPEKRPIMHVFVQVNDLVFMLGNGFLEGALIYSVGVIDNIFSFVESHAHHFLGRQSILIRFFTKEELEETSQQRAFVSELKNTSNWIIFPALYTVLMYNLISDKLEEFYSRYKVQIQMGIFAIGVITCAALIASGALAPVAAPLIALGGPTLGYGVVSTIGVAASAAASFVLPKLTKYVSGVSSFILLLSGASVGLGLGVIGGTISFCGKQIVNVFKKNISPVENVSETIAPPPVGSTLEVTKVLKKNKPKQQRVRATQILPQVNYKQPPARVSDLSFMANGEGDLFAEIEMLSPQTRQQHPSPRRL